MMADWTINLGAPPLWRLFGALVGGGVLGLFYFGGLWWTVRRLENAEHVGLLFFASFTVRTLITVGGLYFVAFWPANDGAWLLPLIALAGFILTRLWLTRRWGPIAHAT